MNKQVQSAGLFIISVFLYASTGFAQDEEGATAPPSGAETEDTTSAETEVRKGQEVEVSEDNYRQFMELRDPRLQRSMLPETSYQSQAGLQKLDKLPEESQKHLRNQLREIIVQGDAWQPGDEDGEYPYVPSEAAVADQPLQKQEAEAWGELIGNYHKREAEIYGNASRSQAAAATAGQAGGGEGSAEGSAAGSAGQGGEAGQNSEQSDSRQTSSANSASPSAAEDSPNARSTEGVSQNAMDFLQSKGQHASNIDEASGGMQGTPEEPTADSTEGAAQNALEYLTGDDSAADSAGTLTIEELLNAQGLRDATGTHEVVDPDG